MACVVALGVAVEVQPGGGSNGQGISTVLVGCKGSEGALAFLSRFERALERATAGRPASLTLSYGIQRLADAESPQQALELAEISAQSAPARTNGTPLGAAPHRGPS